MNVMHCKRKLFWLAPRTSTRYTFSLLRPFGLQGDVRRPDVGTHSVGFPPGTDGYEVVATVRCPFRRMLSAWKWLSVIRDNIPDDFKEFVHATELWQKTLSPLTVHYDVSKVSRVVRLEHYEHDIRKLQILPDGFELPRNTFDSGLGVCPLADFYGTEELAVVESEYKNDIEWSSKWESLTH
jgi:hypothetical protein